MQTISEMSNNLGVEVGFIGIVGEDREIRLGALPPDESNSASVITGLSQQISKTDFDRKDLFLWGHTHPQKAFEKNYGHNLLMMNTDPDNRERITATPSGDVLTVKGLWIIVKRYGEPRLLYLLPVSPSRYTALMVLVDI